MGGGRGEGRLLTLKPKQYANQTFKRGKIQCRNHPKYNTAPLLANNPNLKKNLFFFFVVVVFFLFFLGGGNNRKIPICFFFVCVFLLCALATYKTRMVVHGQLVEPTVCLSDLYDVY